MVEKQLLDCVVRASLLLPWLLFGCVFCRVDEMCVHSTAAVLVAVA
jgi:hypothetical protein